MTTLANSKIRISTKGDGKRDDHKKCLNIMRNQLTDNKKRGSDPLKVDVGKEKRRRRMEYCERVFPASPKMIHRGVWDCEKTPKSHESCRRNPGGRDCQDMNKKTPLQKEKESSRSDHSSRATIDELRVSHMKKRFAHLIFKANHQAIMPHGDNADPLKQQQERERFQVKVQRQREREAVRIALKKMEKTVEFNDIRQIMRDFESLLNTV